MYNLANISTSQKEYQIQIFKKHPLLTKKANNIFTQF